MDASRCLDISKFFAVQPVHAIELAATEIPPL